LQSWMKEIMQTIIINSQKGGSGKTMLSAHLSTQAERDGDGPAYLIDTDPQGTLTKWHSLRLAECSASTTLSHWRQLFLPTNDIYRHQLLTTSSWSSGEAAGGEGRSPEPEAASPEEGSGVNRSTVCTL